MAVVRFTIALACSLAACAVVAKPADPPAAVADLRYGTALYEYYQGNYWNALSELMIANSRGGIAGHGNRPRIMEGTFSLAYGLEDRAAEVFRQVLGSDTEPAVRDAAWFHLARMRYLRGELDGASDALNRISAQPPEKFNNQLRALRINLAIQQGNLAEAKQLLEQQPPADSWLPYVYYNLGAAQSRAGQFPAAVDYYNRVAQMPLWTEEERTVYDRAMTAAGYSYLRAKQYPEAQAQFSRVRVESPLAGSAMLGYGWAAAEQENYLDALTPWQHLAEQPLVDENAQEALLAVPYAYEQLGNKGMALRHFQEAEKRFSQEMNAIEEVVASLEDRTILDALRVQKDSNFNWLDLSETEQLRPRLVYLTDLFARDEFQSHVQELRDLLAVQERLHDWQGKLTLYSDMLDEREAQRRDRANQLQQQALAEQLNDMRAKRDALAAELDRVQREQDYLALSAGQQARLQERVDAVKRNVDALAASGADVEDYREAHRRYAGLLLWQASEAFSERLWDAQKHLAELDEQLQQLEQTHSRVEHAMQSAEDLQPYRTRIASGQERVQQQLAAVDEAIGKLQRQLRGQIETVLQEQHERLRYYLAQSRLSIARLYDSAALDTGAQQP